MENEKQEIEQKRREQLFKSANGLTNALKTAFVNHAASDDGVSVAAVVMGTIAAVEDIFAGIISMAKGKGYQDSVAITIDTVFDEFVRSRRWDIRRQHKDEMQGGEQEQA